MTTAPINLVPETYRRRRLLRRAVSRWVVLGTVYAMMIGLVWGTYAATGARAFRSLVTEQNELANRDKDVKDSLNQTRRQLADAKLRRQIALQLRNRPDWSILLQLLSDQLGDDVTLRDVSLTRPAEAKPTQMKELQFLGPDSAMLTLRGIGTTQQAVSQFALRLQRQGLFTDVNMTRSGRETFGRLTGIGFELQCSLGTEAAAK
jgi:Tfp pilus assembly protein PilN